MARSIKNMTPEQAEKARAARRARRAARKARKAQELGMEVKLDEKTGLPVVDRKELRERAAIAREAAAAARVQRMRDEVIRLRTEADEHEQSTGRYEERYVKALDAALAEDNDVEVAKRLWDAADREQAMLAYNAQRVARMRRQADAIEGKLREEGHTVAVEVAA